MAAGRRACAGLACGGLKKAAELVVLPAGTASCARTAVLQMYRLSDIKRKALERFKSWEGLRSSQIQWSHIFAGIEDRSRERQQEASGAGGQQQQQEAGSGGAQEELQ